MGDYGSESRIVDGYLKKQGIDKSDLKGYEYDTLNYLYLGYVLIQIDLSKIKSNDPNFEHLVRESGYYHNQLVNEINKIRERIRKGSNR